MNCPQIFKFSVATSALCASAIGFTACSNSEESSGSSAKETALSVEVLGKTVGDTLVFDMMDSTYDFKIEADGKWRIEDETGFIQSISEKSGNGDATVKMRLTTNDWDERFVGDLRIVFPEDTSLNKTITVVQKYSGDYDDNIDQVSQSNKAYAMGYGYDMVSNKEGYLAPGSIKAEIFDTKQLFQNETFAYGANTQSLEETSITGSTISDVSFKLGVKANIEGSSALFSGEMKSSFDMSLTNKNNYEYALNYIDIETQTITSNEPVDFLIDSLNMKKSVYYAINGIGDIGRRYPSNNKGFKKMIESFGTHVVMGAKVGARLRQSLTVDISKVTSSYDLGLFAKAAYKGIVVKADGSVESKLKKSFEENRSSIDFKVNVYGGDPKLGGKLMGFTNRELDTAVVGEWKQSVYDGKGEALIGFTNGGLVPLYELIDEYISDSTAERKEKLKAYMESKQFASDFSSFYECGTVTEIDVPKIEDNDTNSLIKDIYLNGQLVAKAALEFVPLLNIKEKVMVIYPVINNRVRFNLGFYIGDKDHKPARVSWEGTDAAIVEYADMDFGAAKKIYIRGSSVTSMVPEGTEPHAGTVEDSYLKSTIFVKAKESQDGFRPGRDGKDVNHNYPLVKMFDHIWLRENYASTLGRSGESYAGIPDYLGFDYWTADCSTNPDCSDVGTAIRVNYLDGKLASFVPSGWQLPSKEDFQEIEKALTTNGVTNVGTAMVRKGLCDSNEDGCGLVGFATRAEYDNFLVTNSKSYVRMRKSGTSFEYESFPDASGVLGQIRFYQE